MSLVIGKTDLLQILRTCRTLEEEIVGGRGFQFTPAIAEILIVAYQQNNLMGMPSNKVSFCIQRIPLCVYAYLHPSHANRWIINHAFGFLRRHRM